MYSAKFKLYHDDCPIVNRCVKFKTNILSYPGHHYMKNGHEFVSTFCKFEDANEALQKRYLAGLRKDQYLTRLDVWGKNFLYEYNLREKGEHVMLYFNNSMMFIKPTVNSMDGHEYWEIACWSKGIIKKFFVSLKKHMTSAKIMHVKKEGNIDFAFPLVTERLSRRQAEVIKLAIAGGYYSFPRKKNLADLAGEIGTTIPTVQEHLRKAEAKILNKRLIL